MVSLGSGVGGRTSGVRMGRRTCDARVGVGVGVGVAPVGVLVVACLTLAGDITGEREGEGEVVSKVSVVRESVISRRRVVWPLTHWDGDAMRGAQNASRCSCWQLRHSSIFVFESLTLPYLSLSHARRQMRKNSIARRKSTYMRHPPPTSYAPSYPSFHRWSSTPDSLHNPGNTTYPVTAH